VRFNSRSEVERIGNAGAFSYSHAVGKLPVTVSRQMSSYWIVSDPVDTITQCFIRDGYWEAWDTLWISQNVRPNSVCIDIGANYGFFTFQLALHGCRVFAIEVHPTIALMLNESVKLNGCGDRVTVINRAVSDFSGKELEFNIQANCLNATIRSESGRFFGPFTSKIKVESLSLDDLCSEEFPKIDFVKMDIDGSEELAWNGMQKFLNKTHNAYAS